MCRFFAYLNVLKHFRNVYCTFFCKLEIEHFMAARCSSILGEQQINLQELNSLKTALKIFLILRFWVKTTAENLDNSQKQLI
jgi:hypothetical protein